MPWGLGDAVSIGLSAIDQIIRDDPRGETAIDVLCNHRQAEVFAHDPRIHILMHVDDSLFPTAAQGTWKRGIFLPQPTLRLARYLRGLRYSAVMPFFFGPAFFYALHTPIAFLTIREGWHALRTLQTYQCRSIRGIVRQNINKFFARNLPEPDGNEPVPLYLRAEHLQKARQLVTRAREQAGLAPGQGSLLLVAPDTSSVITRPPTPLLAQGIAGALQEQPELIVQILPAYTDAQSSQRLWEELVQHFPGRIFLRSTEPQLSLLELAALIDQSEIFITGDTCTMHLAAAHKMLANPAPRTCSPGNQVKIIALFGGTHPGLYGYRQRTIILGDGRKEQLALTPGIAKDLYHAEGKNFFDHIVPHQLTRAILSEEPPAFYAPAQRECRPLPQPGKTRQR